MTAMERDPHDRTGTTAEKLSVRVAGKRLVATDVVCLELVRPDGGELPEFTPGAHIALHVPGGWIRQYSLLNDCTERHRYRIGVLREEHSRGGSQAIHEQVHAGDLLQIGLPVNRFPLQPAARYILLAGGVGITPLLCMARQLTRAGAPFTLHYSNRNRARAAFVEDMADLQRAGILHLHFNDTPGTELDIARATAAAGDDAHLYVCGPPGYIDCVLGHAHAAGIEDARIHFERFILDEDSAADLRKGGAFQVRIKSTGQTCDIPAGEPVTKALERHGVYIPTSCEEGICGTCLTRVLEGIPEHRDIFLTDAEHAANDQFTPCCSRSKTPLLVLDL